MVPMRTDQIGFGQPFIITTVIRPSASGIAVDMVQVEVDSERSLAEIVIMATIAIVVVECRLADRHFVLMVVVAIVVITVTEFVAIIAFGFGVVLWHALRFVFGPPQVDY